MNIKTTYRGEEIRYEEESNTWRWQDTGFGLVSLKAAKQSIDRALDGAPEKPKFKRCSAIDKDYNGFAVVEVTSRKDDREFWIKGKRGRRTRSDLLADTPENRAKINEYMAISKEITALNAKQDAVVDSMQSFTDWLKKRDAKEK